MRRVTAAGMLAAVLCAGAGCGPEGPRIIEGTTLRSTYVGMDYDCGDIVLNLAPDGEFVLGCAPRSETPCEAFDHGPIPVGGQPMRGTWESWGGDLTLTGEDGSVIVFTECEVSVDARGESRLLPGLRWVRSLSPTFADSSSLVARGDLAEFLHPSQGSGTRSSAL